MKKVGILHVPAGSGHERAAQAIAAALTGMDPKIDVSLINALTGADRCYQWAFTSGYIALIQHCPWLWGAAYHLTNVESLQPLSQMFHRLSNAWHGAGLATILLREQFDLVIGTHFFPMEAASAAKRRHHLTCRLVTVITDLLPHTLWLAPAIDTYVIGSEAARFELIRRGVPKEKIEVLGIPIHPDFKGEADPVAFRKKLGLLPDRFTVLIGSGGAGTGPVLEIVRLLSEVRKPIQLVVVAGKNQHLLKRLEDVREGLSCPTRVTGFIDNMPEWMGASDLMVTKPGGLSCSEAMAQGLPLLLVPGIPGQEERNAHLLQKMGVALRVERLTQLPGLVEELIENSGRLATLARKGKGMSSPDAAFQIARIALG